ncbi:orotidine-5'-phosphate decarboxylase [Effusibacillus lacus]|uniref:Orotidine 5'-phosphate decarboxylase n=1 Tax=Effusibacillus lacus TaxID=1348429 RepID=A0A292YE31_9BACL|nr:orotidine-5'-phosphate decarboxylase [Effusibacillus lacus]TCS75640.1 orotidine-5'-phosphate decarboxylase [Effusibacillus lacus]GAX90962.1 orotidine 5'-phosphate decarboxylase [Effusibacillus lacus]
MRNERLTERLYVALDFDFMDEALRMVDQLGDTLRSYKVGMQLFYKTGPVILERLHAEGCKVFLDLKFHDIPNTVAGAAKSATSLGVSMMNVHAAGGMEMMKRAKEASVAAAQATGAEPPLVIAVTQLTSTDQQTMNNQIGIPGTVEAAVIRYAKLAQAAGLDGVVASGHELPAIREACGEEFVTVIPGIRPKWAEANDQKRILTPADAMRAGAHRLVIGRPITHAADPRDAARRILEEMGEVLS